MILLDHRINSLSRLKSVPQRYGVEIDLRDYDGAIRLAHDPYEQGPTLESYLANYRHGPIALNVKCDGIEVEVLERLRDQGIAEFFFVDLPGPALVRLQRLGVSQVAVRVSEYEPWLAAKVFAGVFTWCWLDCFTQTIPDPELVREVARHFKVAVVSPDLHGASMVQTRRFAEAVVQLPISAVCSDSCGLWEEISRGKISVAPSLSPLAEI